MTDKNRISKVEKALAQTHKKRPEIEPDDAWNLRVMNEVRSLPHSRVVVLDAALAPRFVWRFAAVACTLAVAFSIYAFQQGVGLEDLAAKFLFEDPLSILTMGLFSL